jgi:hypothetical protein
MQKNNIISFIIGLVIGLVIGLIVKNFPCITYFSWDKSVSIIDLVSIFITIALALLISLKLDIVAENKKAEKELLISKIEGFENKLVFISELIQNKEPSYIGIVAKYALFREEYQYIINIFNNYKYLDEYKTDLDKNIFVLKYSLTATDNKDLKVTKDKSIYSNERKNEINKWISDIRNVLFKIQLDIIKI